MNADNMTADQWTDQQHAQALEGLKNAGTYVLAINTNDGIKILDGSPGNDGTSMHDQLCMFAMLEGWAKSHRKLIEEQMSEISNEN